MTDFAADLLSTTGVSVTERSGAASGDTVPAGVIVLLRNTSGATAHDTTFTNSATQDGLTVSNRTVTMAISAIKVVRINPLWGDANGRVAMAVAGATPTELKYYILGGA